jgi:hypothetical protein
MYEYWRATYAYRAGGSEENVDMIRLAGVALVLMTAALSRQSGAEGVSGPTEVTLQDDFAAHQAEGVSGLTEVTLQDDFAAHQAAPMALAQKVCVIIKKGSATDSGYSSVTPVPSTWTIATCQRLASGGGMRFVLGCFFANSFSFGAGGASRPSPNCGW